jgi:hypothetical protein
MDSLILRMSPSKHDNRVRSDAARIDTNLFGVSAAMLNSCVKHNPPGP